MDVSLFAPTRSAATRTTTHEHTLLTQPEDVPLTEDVLRRLRESGL